MKEDWEVVKLGEFATYEKGKKPKNQRFDKDEVYKYPYVNIQAFEKGIVDTYTDGEKCNLCCEDDFLMVWDGSRSGLVGKGMNGALGSTLVRINFPGIENDYAYYFLSSKYQEINTRAKGSGTPHVDPYLLWNYDFSIPPLPEQRAIVAKLEELFSDLDKGIADLKTAQEQLKIYRQAVLKKAFEGELTREWREKQKNLPTAEKLLEQIKEDRQKYYEHQIENWKKAVNDWEKNGKEGKKPGKPKKIIEFKLTKQIICIPNNWCSTNLNYIGAWNGGGTPSKANDSFWTNGTVLWVTPKDMKTMEIFESQMKITPESIIKSSAKLIEKDSVLVVLRSGILRRVLPVAINRITCTVNQDLQALTPFKIKSEYIYWYLVSKEFDIRHNCAKDGTTVESIESNSLKEYLFPYCSAEEQNQVVKEIESRISVCDKVEESIVESLEKAKALRQSILKKAFAGTLLSAAEIAKCKTAIDYESASVLLKRIKAEKKK